MLLGIVLLVTSVLVGVGCYLTLRAFRSVDRPPAPVKPRHVKSNPHDAAMTATLKQFFEGKPCVSCGRPIPPVHAGEMRPGLLNTRTHVEIAWADIPAENLSETLDSHAAICSGCLVSESFRRRYPELVIDRHGVLVPASAAGDGSATPSQP
jgi:hypothetical protein